MNEINKSFKNFITFEAQWRSRQVDILLQTQKTLDMALAV
jgi:hypothetical protein